MVLGAACSRQARDHADLEPGRITGGRQAEFEASWKQWKAWAGIGRSPKSAAVGWLDCCAIPMLILPPPTAGLFLHRLLTVSAATIGFRDGTAERKSG
jgi:hypothetical protein